MRVVGVDLVSMGIHQSMRRARVDLERRVLDELSFKSSVKSVSENALMQSIAPFIPHCIPCNQKASRIPCVALFSARLAPKNGALRSLKNCDRSCIDIM